MRSRSSRIPLLECLLVAAAACVVPALAPRAETDEPPDPATAPSLEELMNMKYSGVGSGGAVKLVDGHYENKQGRRSVTLARGFRLTGDLNADGHQEAVVLLAENKGASGTFGYVTVVGRKGTAPAQLATAVLGDRVQVRGARIEKRRLVVDVLRAGPKDAMCCPGELATVAWELSGSKLKSVPTGAKTERLSLAALVGPVWVMRSWAWDDPAPEGVEITFEVSGNRVSGRAGCNRYFADATPGESPGNFTIGGTGTTRMACPDPQMAAETRFLGRLETVRRYSFVAGQLALSWTEGDKVGTMLFERRSAEP